MKPLDLTTAPPRLPHAKLDGIIFLPRSIDKARSRLPGGKPGEYNLTGLTTTMLDKLGVTVEAFSAAVAAAETDDDVVAALRRMTTQEKLDAWNAFIAKREPRGDRNLAMDTYPWLRSRPDMITALDCLAEDDRVYFSAFI